MKVGDEITFTSENKGGKDRISSIGGTATSSATSPSFPKPSGKSAFVPKDPKEFNFMMATRYALDAIIAGAAASPKEAAILIRDLYNAIANVASEPIPETRPTSVLQDQIQALTVETGIDTNGKPWKDYLFKRFKSSTPTNGQLGDLINLLMDVRKGKMKFSMTPDGILTTVLI